MIPMTCPECGHAFEAGSADGGRTTECPSCRKTVPVPLESQVQPAGTESGPDVGLWFAGFIGGAVLLFAEVTGIVWLAQIIRAGKSELPLFCAIFGLPIYAVNGFLVYFFAQELVKKPKERKERRKSLAGFIIAAIIFVAMTMALFLGGE